MEENKLNKIIGVGLDKTGTTSLGVMLETLGYRIKGGWYNGIDDLLNDNIKRIEELIDYDGYIELPFSIIYKELDKYFPNSKFIYTTRKDAQSWVNSQINHFLNAGDKKLFINYIKNCYGYDNPLIYEKELIEYYNNHDKGVKEYFKGRDDFMIFSLEDGDGWEKLCKFLDKPIIREKVPYLKHSDYSLFEKRKQIAGRKYKC